eukprot:gene4806-6734_t
MIQLLFVLLYLTQIDALNQLNFFTSLLPGVGRSSSIIKNELLTLCRKVNRGLSETAEDKSKLFRLFEELEKISDKNTLKNKYLSAVWELEYTTSDSILGRGKKTSEKVGKILQEIDVKNLRAKNSENVKYFGLLTLPGSVTAELAPVSGSKVSVKFKVFKLGPISFNAPESAIGSLDVTYVDDEIRLSRGDKGNIFVLTRFSDLNV